MTILGELGFYLAFAITLILLLWVRDLLSRSKWALRWGGVPLLLYSLLMLAIIFGSWILYLQRVEPFAHSIANEWVGFIYFIGPLIWGLIVGLVRDHIVALWRAKEKRQDS